MREDSVTLVSLELAKEIFRSYLHWHGCLSLLIFVPPYINISPTTFELYWILFYYIHRLKLLPILDDE